MNLTPIETDARRPEEVRRHAIEMKYERPSQRRHHRVTAPLTVIIDGKRHKATDWSLGGFRLLGMEQDVTAGDTLDSVLVIPFQGFEVSFEVAARIVRRDPGTGELACAFVELGERAASILAHFVDEIVRGYMVSAEDTIQRIDVPVTPVSILPETAQTEAARPPWRRRAKSLFMGAFYASAGLLLFGYITTVAYTEFFRLEVDAGVVSAPVEPLLATTDGRVARVHVAEGALVEAGAPLVTLEDPRLEQAIALATVRAELSRARSAGLKSDSDGLAGLPGNPQGEAARAKHELRLAELELAALQAERARHSLLAPARGRLISVMRGAGLATSRGETLALFERDEERVIDVFLTQEEALEVGLGDQAAVYFPATGARVTSVVSAVDRTSGYIDEVGSRYHWRGPKDRSARVTLGFTDMDAAEIRLAGPRTVIAVRHLVHQHSAGVIGGIVI